MAQAHYARCTLTAFRDQPDGSTRRQRITARCRKVGTHWQAWDEGEGIWMPVGEEVNVHVEQWEAEEGE